MASKIPNWRKAGILSLAAATAFSGWLATAEPANAADAGKPATQNGMVLANAANKTAPSDATAEYLVQAFNYSLNKKGIALVLVTGKNDTKDYTGDLRALMKAMKAEGISSAVFGTESAGDKTYLHFLVRDVTFTGFPVGTVRRGNMDGYSPEDIINGRVLADAKIAYNDTYGIKTGMAIQPR